VLKIIVGIGTEDYNEATNEFVNSDYFTLEFEHSLASLSKWEAEFEKPFLSTGEKTEEESLFYIKECMLLTKNPPEGIFDKLSKKDAEDIQNYINNKKSSTWFNDPKNRPMGPRKQVITSAVIYGWLVALRIPFETQYWNLTELFALVRVCNEQNKAPTKVSRAQAAREQAALNDKRRAEMGTRG
jgi:hypothetical protein